MTLSHQIDEQEERARIFSEDAHKHFSVYFSSKTTKRHGLIRVGFSLNHSGLDLSGRMGTMRMLKMRMLKIVCWWVYSKLYLEFSIGFGLSCCFGESETIAFIDRLSVRSEIFLGTTKQQSDLRYCQAWVRLESADSGCIVIPDSWIPGASSGHAPGLACDAKLSLLLKTVSKEGNIVSGKASRRQSEGHGQLISSRMS